MKRQSTQISKNHRGTSPSFYWWPLSEAKIREAAQKIADYAKPQKIILFGSFAYGDPTPDSDVDFLIIAESPQSPRVLAREISEILYPRPFPVDILVRSPAEIARRVELGDCFILEILKKGKILYERPGGQ